MARTTVCFSCGEPTSVVVQNVSAPYYKRYVCIKEQCWAEWRKLPNMKPA